MAIPSNKKRLALTLNNEYVDALKEYSKMNKRSISSEIEIFIEQVVFPALEENKKVK